MLSLPGRMRSEGVRHVAHLATEFVLSVHWLDMAVNSRHSAGKVARYRAIRLQRALVPLLPCRVL